MARYFKITEIDCDSFFQCTGEELDCSQLVVPVIGYVFVAVDVTDADVAEVKRGKWVKPHWRNSVSCANCSICGAEAYHYDFHGVQKTYRYCPNCGAKMGAEG